MLQYLPYVLGAAGAVQGYRQAKDSGQRGIGRLLGTAGGAFAGYNLGQVGGFAKNAGFTPFRNTQFAENLGLGATNEKNPRSLADILFRKQGEKGMETDPLKVAALAGGLPFLMGAFNQGPVDVYQPTYNLAYGEFAKQRPGYTYIDPTTGQEKEYAPVYIPVSYTHLTLPTNREE